MLDQIGWLAGSVAYSADGKTLFVGGSGGHVRAYDADTFKQLWDTDGGGKFAASPVAPDGKTLAVDLQGRRPLPRRGHRQAGDRAGGEGERTARGRVLPGPKDGGEEDPADGSKVIFGSARGYFVKMWLIVAERVHDQSSRPRREGSPTDEYAVPLAVAPDGKRAVITGPIDRDTGKNVLWA